LPNWCSNTVKVWGKVKDVEEAEKRVRKGKTPFSFNGIIPMPKELKNTKSPPDDRNPDLISRFGSDNWFDWCSINWGTKWDLDPGDTTITRGPRSIHYKFDTAWCPPAGIYLQLLSELSANISWGYFEGDMEAEEWLTKDYATEIIDSHKRITEYTRALNADWKKD